MSTSATGKIRILISDCCGGVRGRLLRLLPSLRVSTELCDAPSEEIVKVISESAVDAVILSGGEFDIACEIARQSAAAVLLLTDRGTLTDIEPACVCEGICAAENGELERVFPLVVSACVKLRVLKLQTNTLRRKLNDTRLVSRAKLLLMTRLGMSEDEAHKYIEKTAMSTGAKRGEVAQSIIRTYEE